MDFIKISTIEERDKIEVWTLATFPNIIKFIEDAKESWIVGTEVLSDPAYEKMDDFDGTKEESLKSYLTTKSTIVVYEPKPESDGTKEPTSGTK